MRSLGSASDRSRLIQAYVLGLAHAATVDLAGPVPGLHPGFVILDEPLQQNHDTKHRRRFIDYLVKQGAKQPPYQVIIFTYLFEGEMARLRESGVTLQTPEKPERQYFLILSYPSQNRSQSLASKKHLTKRLANLRPRTTSTKVIARVFQP